MKHLLLVERSLYILYLKIINRLIFDRNTKKNRTVCLFTNQVRLIFHVFSYVYGKKLVHLLDQHHESLNEPYLIRTLLMQHTVELTMHQDLNE